MTEANEAEVAKENRSKETVEGVKAPLDCVVCLRSIGPMYPVGEDCAGWMCDECYQKMQNETENEG